MPVVKKQEIPKPVITTDYPDYANHLTRIADALGLIAGHLENANENSEQFARTATALENLVKEINFAVTKV